MIALLIGLIIIFFGVRLYTQNQRRTRKFQLPPGTSRILLEQVAFYRTLDDSNKKIFENRIQDFLQQVSITGIGTQVEDLDRILIASGAIIPIFAFPGWKYSNLSEVLLYKDAFNLEYATEGDERNVLGMVGEGALQRQMILSQPSVRSSFQYPEDGHNTVIHEFVHLIDKADGAIDGIPEYLLSRPYILPWINRIHETIREMKQTDSSDINYYATTNDAEFFAVVSEYFFERPTQLKTNHPELYGLLEQMFHPGKNG